MTATAKTIAARALAAARKTHGGGRPPKPAYCARCGTLCPSTVAAREHCPKEPKKENAHA